MTWLGLGHEMSYTEIVPRAAIEPKVAHLLHQAQKCLRIVINVHSRRINVRFVLYSRRRRVLGHSGSPRRLFEIVVSRETGSPARRCRTWRCRQVVVRCVSILHLIALLTNNFMSKIVLRMSIHTSFGPVTCRNEGRRR